jgi:hypothetical protein
MSSAKQTESPSTKKTSSVKPQGAERRKLEQAIGSFLDKAAAYPEILEDSLYAWITTRREGCGTLRKLTMHATENLQKTMEARNNVVLLMHNDGTVEVYGGPNLSVKAYTMPWWPVDAALGQELIEMSMPEQIVRMIWPNQYKNLPGLVETLQVRYVTLDRGHGDELCCTWTTCENPWLDPPVINEKLTGPGYP